MATPDHEICAGFWADANPVHAVGRGDGAVGLNADAKAAHMQRLDQRRIDLQQRFATGQDGIAFRVGPGPLRGDGVGEFSGRGIAPAQRSVGADKIGVAKPACRAGAILLAAAPEIAAREPAEDRGPAGMRAFALQGEKDFLDRVTQRTVSWMLELVCRSASPSAMAAAIATLSERR